MNTEIINRTMDRDDLDRPEIRPILDEIFEVIGKMREKGIDYSTWYGRLSSSEHNWYERANRGRDYEPFPGNPDDAGVPWFLLWEISWVIRNTDPKAGDVCLDLGGSSSLFSCLLAHRGCKVVSVELNSRLVEHQKKIAGVMGWDMDAHNVNMLDMEFPEGFADRIYSICVYEHIPREIRLRINKRLHRFLKAGGIMGITFDYQSREPEVEIDTPKDVREQFLETTGFRPLGNETFVDNGKRYMWEPFYSSFSRKVHGILKGKTRSAALINGDRGEYTFAALFMEKPMGA